MMDGADSPRFFSIPTVEDEVNTMQGNSGHRFPGFPGFSGKALFLELVRRSTGGPDAGGIGIDATQAALPPKDDPQGNGGNRGNDVPPTLAFQSCKRNGGESEGNGHHAVSPNPAVFNPPAQHPIVIDFETRSPLDLRRVGVAKYLEHPATQALLMVAALPDGSELIWRRGDAGVQEELSAWVERGHPIAFHNLEFDLGVIALLLDWELPNTTTYLDTLLLARSVGLPGDLDQLGKLLFGVGKDPRGEALLKNASTIGPDGRYVALTPSELDALTEYARRDVELTRRLWHEELKFHANPEDDVIDAHFTISNRGFHIDVDLARAIAATESLVAARALAHAQSVVPGLTATDLRGVMRFRKLLTNRGIEVTSTERADLELLLRPDVDPAVQALVRARLAVNRVTGGKAEQAISWVSGDGRVRGALNYFGAHTGRWSGKGFQPQNLPRDTVQREHLEDAIEAALTRDPDRLEAVAAEACTTPDQLLAGLVRPIITAPTGRTLLILDYSTIEPRMLLWLAEDEDNLAVFARTGVDGDPYRQMAAPLFNKSPGELEKGGIERQLGKALVIGCGYGMGSKRFRAHAEEDYGVDWITLERRGITPQLAVDAWRDAHPAVGGVRTGHETDDDIPCRTGGLWKVYENAARRATHGGMERVGPVSWERRDAHVVCVLPSGRELWYRDLRVGSSTRPDGELNDNTLMYRQRTGWVDTFGGKLTENVTQAACRDILADALVRLEASGFEVVVHAHDEVVIEVDEEFASERLLEAITLMETAPPWARGLPLKVEGGITKRYRKI